MQKKEQYPPLSREGKRYIAVALQRLSADMGLSYFRVKPQPKGFNYTNGTHFGPHSGPSALI